MNEHAEDATLIVPPTQKYFIPAVRGKIVKLRRGSGKDWQGMAPKAKGLKA